MENRSLTSLLASNDRLQRYIKNWEEENKAKLKLQSELEFKQGELANEKRMRQWLETRLDKVVHALASKEATQKYRDEYKAEDLIKTILELTRNDLLNEKRLRKKLEQTIAVLELAKAVEQYQKKFQGEKKATGILHSALEITQFELTKEKETVRVLEETIADLEQPIMDDIKKTDIEEGKQAGCLLQLESAQYEFLAERQARQRLERKLAELEETLPSNETETKQDETKNEDNTVKLERMQDELSVERKMRRKLEKKLVDTEGTKASDPTEQKNKENKEAENMLQTLLKCTLDKLSNERKVRRTLEEKLALLERAVQKEQAKTKFEEIFLELTQNELTQEREVRQNLEKQLADIEEATVAEDAKTTSQEGMKEENQILKTEDMEEDFDAKLEALEKIIMSIQAKNKYEEEEMNEDQSTFKPEQQKRLEKVVGQKHEQLTANEDDNLLQSNLEFAKDDRTQNEDIIHNSEEKLGFQETESETEVIKTICIGNKGGPIQEYFLVNNYKEMSEKKKLEECLEVETVLIPIVLDHIQCQQVETMYDGDEFQEIFLMELSVSQHEPSAEVGVVIPPECNELTGLETDCVEEKKGKWQTAEVILHGMPGVEAEQNLEENVVKEEAMTVTERDQMINKEGNKCYEQLILLQCSENEQKGKEVGLTLEQLAETTGLKQLTAKHSKSDKDKQMEQNSLQATQNITLEDTNDMEKVKETLGDLEHVNISSDAHKGDTNVQQGMLTYTEENQFKEKTGDQTLEEKLEDLGAMKNNVERKRKEGNNEDKLPSVFK